MLTDQEKEIAKQRWLLQYWVADVLNTVMRGEVKLYGSTRTLLSILDSQLSH